MANVDHINRVSPGDHSGVECKVGFLTPAFYGSIPSPGTHLRVFFQSRGRHTRNRDETHTQSGESFNCSAERTFLPSFLQPYESVRFAPSAELLQ